MTRTLTLPHPIARRDLPDKEPALLHEFFERAAHTWPGRIAVETPPSSTRPERRTITYAEHDGKSNALAAYLREFVTGECVVAILLPRTSEHIYLAQLAVSKAGAAFTCLDPVFPDDQVKDVLDDARPVAVLTDAAGLARARRLHPNIPCFLDVVSWIDRLDGLAPPVAPASWVASGSLAYLIYTSGTTGHPKGVMIEQRGIVNLVAGDLRSVGVRPDDRVGQSSSAAYDSSVEETWFAFAAGATLVVMDDETARLGPDLVPWLRRERITMFCPPPTLLRSTGCEHPERELPDLRLLHVGGEALSEDIAERWARGRRLVNDYGPTETTVTALRGLVEAGKPVAIGRPVPGLSAWVLNDQLEEVAIGEQGELCLGGVGLARGYMGSPELTERKFPVHPRLGRIYRTGDLVHRDADGNFYCQGRIDAQVKMRGYRIELEAIETRLLECPGVRAAACRVQGEGGQQKIAAFIVPVDAARPPCFNSTKELLRQLLPSYMVPSVYGVLAELPTTVSGKLNRRALPRLELTGSESGAHVFAPRDRLELKLTSAVRKLLGLTTVSIEHDFFNDLGGNSLLAAQLISVLRNDPATAALTVRDLYEARTIAELAKRVPANRPLTACAAPRPAAARTPGRPILATCVQTAWLLILLTLGAPVAYLLAFHALPYLTNSLGLVPFLVLVPLLYFAGLSVYAAAAVGLTVLVKKALIGRYRPLSAPVWGSFFVRNWIVQQTARLIPWRSLEGTLFQQVALRALGARIGQRVHIHRGVNLAQGGWDLLEIGDDVTLSQEAFVRLVDLDDGQIVVAPVTLGDRCTLDIRAGVAGNTRVEAEAYLTPLSYLASGGVIPQGECWDGVPAKKSDRPAPNAALPDTFPAPMSPALHGLAMFAGRVVVGLMVVLPLEALGLAVALWCGIGFDGAEAFAGIMSVSTLLVGAAALVLAVPLSLCFQCLAMRLLGPVREGTISRWSLAYVRVWLKTSMLENAALWLSGSLLWRWWLRGAGMKLGRGCEIGIIIDTVPELVTIGDSTFFADGIYLAGPRVHRGTVTLAAVRLGKNTFLGNHAVVAVGQALPDNVLLGVCTVADDTQVRPGTSWFGHPPFELPQREVVACDRRLTHEPSPLRSLVRVFWELLRFALPVGPALAVVGWFALLARAEEVVSLPVLLLAVVPALELAVVVGLCLFVLVLKWLLLGSVRPGQHPLWSSWVSRWDFHYVVWEQWARGPLSALEGTLWLNWYLRAMGMRIGKRVVLGYGFAQVVDPDMLIIEDDATVSAMFQAHTFEDRVLKMDHVFIRACATVGNAAVVLYGADIGRRTHVLPHSVVMKRERLLDGNAYQGCPTRSSVRESPSRLPS